LFGSDHYKSDRPVVKPSPWPEGDFEEKMATLRVWASALNRSNPAFADAQQLLEGEESVIGASMRCLGVQTRRRKDLDIAIELKQAAALREFLHKQEYRDTKLEIARPYA
jgi:hypothetical protein